MNKLAASANPKKGNYIVDKLADAERFDLAVQGMV